MYTFVSIAQPGQFAGALGIYEETIRYGVNARAGKSWAICANPRCAYPTLEAVMAKLPEVAAGFTVATQAVGGR